MTTTTKYDTQKAAAEESIDEARAIARDLKRSAEGLEMAADLATRMVNAGHRLEDIGKRGITIYGDTLPDPDEVHALIPAALHPMIRLLEDGNSLTIRFK